MSMNSCHFTGCLTRDPECRPTQNGGMVMRLGLAVNDRVNNNGQWQDRPNFLDLVVFGKRAEALQRSLHKGMKVAAACKARWSQWQGQDGRNRSKVEFVVDDIEFMEPRQQQGQQGGYHQPQQYAPAPQAAPQQAMPHQPPQQQVPLAPEIADSDLPF